MPVIVGDNHLRQAIERYFRDGTPYTFVLLEEGRRRREALAEAVKRRAQMKREQKGR